MTNNTAGIRFTGKTYFCPKCKQEIDGYLDSFWKTPKGKIYKSTRPDEDSDEDEDIYEWKEVAGCVRCFDFWFVKDLQQKVVFQFR